MNRKSAKSLQNMCRTCMIQFHNAPKESSINSKQCIYEVPVGCTEDATIMDLLQMIQPQIKVDVKDKLPTLMCFNCVQKLLIAHEFIKMYKDVDTKFRKMLKVVDNCKYDIKALDYNDEIIEEKLHEEEILDENNEDVHEITMFEFEIESVNNKVIEIQEINKKSEANWQKFEDDLEHEVFNGANDREQFLINSSSDASGNEWTSNETCKKVNKKTIDSKRKSTCEFINNNTPLCNTAKIKKKAISNYKEDSGNKMILPKQNIDGTIPCQECDSVLDNASLWQQHIRQYHLGKNSKRKYIRKSRKPKKDYECEHCGKAFPKITAYKNHVRTHTGEEPYLCIECGKSFKVVSSLNTHMLRHKGEKTIQCPHCPKKFVCSSGLYGHMMVHRKEKPFVCDICGSAFHMAYQLRKHNLYHNGIKNYQCEYCDMKFVTSEKQRRHMRTHTGEKPYRCKYCERAFAQSNDCVKHLRQHLGDNVYQCELCPLRFPLARDLRTHFATHKDDDEETRDRNLKARLEEERNLQIKLCVQELE